MSPAYKGVLICAGLLAAFSLGRYTAKAPQETVQAASQEEIAAQATETTASETIADHSATQEAVERTEAVTERVRVVYRERRTTPDGATEERSLEVDAETARLLREVEESRAEVASLRAQLAERQTLDLGLTASHTLDRQVSAPPTWMVGLTAIYDTGLGRTAIGPQTTFRLAGPLHLGGAVALPGLAPPLVQVSALVEF